MELKETGLIIKQIDSLYPGRLNLERSTVEIWHRVLGKQDYEKTLDRLVKYSRENKFPPSAADLHLKESEAYKSNILDQIKEWEQRASGKQ